MIIIKKLSLISVLFFICQGFGQVDVEISKITGADLICKNKGAMFAFDFEHGKEKVWQSDSGEVTGIELTGVKVTYYRCPSCYDVTATMQIADARIEYNFVIRSESGKKTAAELSVSSEGQAINTMKMSCEVAANK